MDPKDQELVKQSINRILANRDYLPVKNFANDFSDGILFQIIVNQLFVTNINL